MCRKAVTSYFLRAMIKENCKAKEGEPVKLPVVRKLVYGLLAVFCVMMLLYGWTKVSLFCGLAIAAVIWVGILNIALWRCPHCGKNLGRMEKQKYCPHCGKELKM